MTGEQVKEVESVVTWKCVDTDQLLLPTDIKYYYTIGNEPIVFTKDELADVRSFGEPGKVTEITEVFQLTASGSLIFARYCAGLKLIGFLDQRHVLPHWNIRPPYFIYPNEFVSTCFHCIG